MTLTDEQIRQKFEEAVEKPSLSIFWNEKIGSYMSVHLPRKAEAYNLMYETFCSGFKSALSLQGEAVPVYDEVQALCQLICNSPPNTVIAGEIESRAFALGHFPKSAFTSPPLTTAQQSKDKKCT